MDSTNTNLPLHEVILQILFVENTEKAAEMTSQDVLWRIDNPEISERQVREVLDWLVVKKKASLYLGKYSIDRIEFLEQKEIYKTSLSSNHKKNRFPPSKSTKEFNSSSNSFFLNSPKQKNNKYTLIFLCIGVIVFGYFTYVIASLNHNLEPTKNLLTPKNTSIDSLQNQNRLYTSRDEDYSVNAKNAISNSFAIQNTINATYTNEINKLHTTLDSISNSHKNELTYLQQELESNSNRFNSSLKSLVYTNVIIIVLFLALYFKKT